MTTKEKILDALLSIASKKGTGNTSMDDIAKAVGIRKSSLYFYYPSKSAMLKDMYLSFREKEAKPVVFAEDAPLETILYDRLVAYIHLASETKMAAVFRLIENEKFIDKDAEDLYLQETHRMLQSTQDLFRSLSEKRGVIFDDVDAAGHVYALYAHELVLLAVLGDLDMAEAKERIISFVSHYTREKR